MSELEISLKVTPYMGNATIKFQVGGQIVHFSDGRITTIPNALSEEFAALSVDEIRDAFGALEIVEGCEIDGLGHPKCPANGWVVIHQIEHLSRWVDNGLAKCEGMQKQKWAGISTEYTYKRGVGFVPKD